MKIEEIFGFIKKHDLMLLATVNGDKPQAAVVEFGELDDMTLIIDTISTSRKYKNLQRNPNIAAVIGWDDSVTVQIDGTAHELSGDKLAQAKQAYFAKNPRAKKWENRPNMVYIAIKPTWLRYSDLRQNPWLVQEFLL